MPWGVPDLQGVWDHGTATPLKRPSQYEGREFLTTEEIAQANLNATTFASSERRSELSPERDVGLAYQPVLVGPRTFRRTDGADYRPAGRADPGANRQGGGARRGPTRSSAHPAEIREPGRSQRVGTLPVARHRPIGRGLQQQPPDLPERRSRGDPARDGPRDADHPAGRQRTHRSHAGPVAGPLTRTLGGRHAGGRDPPTFLDRPHGVASEKT